MVSRSFPQLTMAGASFSLRQLKCSRAFQAILSGSRSPQIQRISAAEVRAVCGQSNSALQRWTIWSWTALSVRQNWLVSFADGPIRSATPVHLISGPGHQVKKRGFLTVMPFTVKHSIILAHPNITFSRKESFWNSCRVSDSTSSIEETHKSHPM